jgi:hypothetical protein
MNFIEKLFHKDNLFDFLYNSNGSFILAKQKHKNVFVFYKNKKVIILDKRKKNTNVYMNLQIACKKLNI